MKKDNEEQLKKILFSIRKIVLDLAESGDKEVARRWVRYFNEMVDKARPTSFPLRKISESYLWGIEKKRAKIVVRLPRPVRIIFNFLFSAFAKAEIREIKIPFYLKVRFFVQDSRHSCDFCGGSWSMPTDLFCFYPPSPEEGTIIKLEVCGEKVCREIMKEYRKEIIRPSYQEKLSSALLGLLK